METIINIMLVAIVIVLVTWFMVSYIGYRKIIRKQPGTYKLNWGQKLNVFWAKMAWDVANKNDRKETFHLVLRGSEKHEHHYTIPITKRGYKFLGCDHEGCDMMDPID